AFRVSALFFVPKICTSMRCNLGCSSPMDWRTDDNQYLIIHTAGIADRQRLLPFVFERYRLFLHVRSAFRDAHACSTSSQTWPIYLCRTQIAPDLSES